MSSTTFNHIPGGCQEGEYDGEWSDSEEPMSISSEGEIEVNKEHLLKLHYWEGGIKKVL